MRRKRNGLTMTNKELIDLVTSINSFYGQAWNQLLVVLSIGVALLAIVIPVIFQVIQSRTLKNYESELKNSVDKHGAALKEMIEAHFRKSNENLERKVQESVAASQTAIRSEIASAKGGLFYVQGNMMSAQGRLGQALNSYFDAVLQLIQSTDETNTQRSLTAFSETLEKIQTTKAPELIDLPHKIKKLMTTVDSKNENGRYQDYLMSIRRNYEGLKERSV